MMQLLSSFPWMRRFVSTFAFLAAALVLMIPLAACGGGSSSGGSTTSSGPVKLTYWSWIGGMDKQVALFNQTHPNIHVTVQNVGAGPVEYDKLFTAIKANNEPDVSEVEFQTLPQFETTGSLVDISKYGANSVKDQFPAWMWSQVTLANGVYAIPQDGGPMELYYREDIFKKYNLPVPTTCRPERLPPGSPPPGGMASSSKMPPRPPGSGALLPCPSGRRVKTSVATGVDPRPSSSRVRSIRRRPVRLPNGSAPTNRVP